jgi:hypothetical protein
MTIKVIAVETGFYGGRLREPGTASANFDVANERELGSWMRRVDRKDALMVVPSAAQLAEQEQRALAAEQPSGEILQLYRAKHAGAGHWEVVDVDGKQVGETFKRDPQDKDRAKALATAEADQLNAEAAGISLEAADIVQVNDLPDA